jgi:DNA-binding transcriptional regulator YiaG
MVIVSPPVQRISFTILVKRESNLMSTVFVYDRRFPQTKEPFMHIGPEQSRAARGLIEWSQTELATKSNLSESTIRDFEKGRRIPSTNNLSAIRIAFEAAGVMFLASGESTAGGPGVRLVNP